MGDEVKVFLKYSHLNLHSGAGEWLDAKVLRIDESLGLYCIGRSGTFCIWVVVEQLRLVAVAAKTTISAQLAADAAELADIELWDEGTLRANQNTCSARVQGLIAIVRQRRNVTKRWCDGLARVAKERAERAERFAAEAPARAAAKAKRAEEKKAERALAPPRTRSSHLSPEFGLRALEEEAAAPRHAVFPPTAENSESESESESEGAWQAEDLAAMGIVAGTCLPCTFPSFREFCALRELRGGAFEEIAARIAAVEDEEEEAS